MLMPGKNFLYLSQLFSFSRWVGLTKFGHEGGWFWPSNNEMPNIDNWDTGSPDKSAVNSKDCVALISNSKTTDAGDFPSHYRDLECFAPPQVGVNGYCKLAF